MKRRDFLKASALATAAVVSYPLDAHSSNEKSLVKNYREIGRTGLKMSDISLGCGELIAPSMVLRAVDRGINYLDTAPAYGPSEKNIGQAMKKIKRDKIIIASKFSTDRGLLRSGSRKKDYIAVVDGSLSRMNTDYLDFVFIHAIGILSKSKEDETRRLLAEEMLSAVDTLKRDGKIRFLGVSSHGPNHMEELLMTAINSGNFDVIMPAFNFLKFPKLPEVIKEAKKKGMGVVAMKTLAGAKDMGLDPKKEAFEPAAFKWVLSHKAIAGLVITIKTVSQLNLYLTASGRKFTSADRDILNRYARKFSGEYCRTGCGECETSCPDGVEIATSLRYRMYFEDYGAEKKAMKSYAALKNNAGACLTCEGNYCDGACPYGLEVKALMSKAHDTLSFNV